MTQPAASRNTRAPRAAKAQAAQSKFPKVPAPKGKCACCNRAIIEGYDVPFIGVVGPVCVHKYEAMIHMVQDVDGFTLATTNNQTVLRAVKRLLVHVDRIGFDIKVEHSTDGTQATLHVGPRKRKLINVVQTWRERRAEFEADLKIAQGDNGVVGTVTA